MLSSDVGLLDAFSILGRQSVDPALAESCELVARGLSAGSSLPKAMATAPELFNTFDTRLAEVGMMTGHLAQSVAMAASHYERIEKMRSQAWSALAYPMITLAFCLVLAVVVPPLVFNSIFEMLRDSGVELPFLSRAVMAFSEAVQSPWFWFFVTVGSASAGKLCARWLRKPESRLSVGRALLSIPVLGSFIRAQAIASFTNALATLVAAGISLHRAFPVAAEATGNPVLVAAVTEATERVLSGESAAESLKVTQFFPSLFLLSVSAGEEVGDLVAGLQNTSRLYEIDLDSRTEAIFSLLSPMVTLLLGVIVGTVNLAVLLPLMELMKKL